MCQPQKSPRGSTRTHDLNYQIASDVQPCIAHCKLPLQISDRQQLWRLPLSCHHPSEHCRRLGNTGARVTKDRSWARVLGHRLRPSHGPSHISLFSDKRWKFAAFSGVYIPSIGEAIELAAGPARPLSQGYRVEFRVERVSKESVFLWASFIEGSSHLGGLRQRPRLLGTSDLPNPKGLVDDLVHKIYLNGLLLDTPI